MWSCFNSAKYDLGLGFSNFDWTRTYQDLSSI